MVSAVARGPPYHARMPSIEELDPRVALAAERTLLAWIRTGIALMGFGFVVSRFGLFLRELTAVNAHLTPGGSNASLTGVMLVAAGIAVNIWASVRHVRMMARLRRGESDVVGLRGPVSMGIASGVGGLVLLAVLMAAFLR
jgi:putative membrane protein